MTHQPSSSRLSSRDRRDFLFDSARAVAAGTLAAGVMAGPGLLGGESAIAGRTFAAENGPALGKAEHCIFLWLGGGMAHKILVARLQG